MPLFGPPNIEKLKSRKDVPGLIKALGYLKKQKIRTLAAEALGEVGDRQAIEPLLALLSDENPDQNIAAISALGKLRASRAVPLLVARLREKGITSRTAELSALLNIGDPAVGPLLDLLNETAKETRQALILIETIEKIGGQEATAGLQALLSLKNPNLIPHLVETFVRMGERQTIPLLVSLLKAAPAEPWTAHVVEGLLQLEWTPDSDLEKTALYLVNRDWKKLAEIGKPAVEHIIPLLRNSRSETILQAVETLGAISDVRAVEPLAALLEDRRPEIAASASRSLGKTGSVQAVEPLLQALLDVEDASVQAEAKNALCRIGELAVPHLIACLESMDPHERYVSIVLLGEISDRRAVLPLKTQLKSMDPMEIKAAVVSLGQIGDPLAVDALVPLSDDPTLQPEIHTSLARLGWEADKS